MLLRIDARADFASNCEIARVRIMSLVMIFSAIYGHILYTLYQNIRESPCYYAANRLLSLGWSGSYSTAYTIRAFPYEVLQGNSGLTSRSDFRPPTFPLVTACYGFGVIVYSSVSIYQYIISFFPTVLLLAIEAVQSWTNAALQSQSRRTYEIYYILVRAFIIC